MSQRTDIDALLQNTWLQVISLHHGPTFTDGEGKALWQRCVADVDRVQQALKDADVSEASRNDVLLAQCALLDEAVKGRGKQDDACVQWYQMPLQGHFLGTIDAGETLCDRMRQRLADPTTDAMVLTCFHRVLMLGFLGAYASVDVPERVRLADALAARVPPFSRLPAQSVLATGGAGRGAFSWLRAWPVRLCLIALLLAALWWGLHHWLDVLLASLLPGVKG